MVNWFRLININQCHVNVIILHDVVAEVNGSREGNNALFAGDALLAEHVF